MTKKGSGIFRGNKELTASEVKSFIMQQHGWTSLEYQKEYDKLRNRVRNLESYKRAQGVSVPKQNVSAILYREAKAMKTYGARYTPSQEIERLRSFTSVSTGSFKPSTVSSKLEQSQRTYVEARFAGLMTANSAAHAIYERLKNEPAKAEKALAEFASKIHATPSGAGAIPSGYAIGSTDEDSGFDLANEILGELEEVCHNRLTLTVVYGIIQSRRENVGSAFMSFWRDGGRDGRQGYKTAKKTFGGPQNGKKRQGRKDG